MADENLFEVKLKLTADEVKTLEAYIKGLRTTNEAFLALAKAIVREFGL